MFTKRSLYSFLLLLIPVIVQAQADTVQQRIFLVGDAGQLYENKHPVIDWMKKNINWDDTINRVIFLGDNIYEHGLPMVGEPDYEEAKKAIDYQIGLVKGKKAKAYFIPGNHDWKNGKQGGVEQIANQTNYINGLGLPNVQAWPLDACPGPVLTEVDNKVVIVFGDSQWFLYLHDKPGPESACAAKTIEEFTTELNEMIASHPNQLLIFAMHHPFITYGSHGGDYSWKDHIFPFTAMSKNLYIPLPVIGSAYPVSRGYFGSIQDVYHPLYRNMVTEIEGVLKKHPNPILVGGHEHGLQLNVKDTIPYVVSGSGSKLTRLKKGKYSVFAHLYYGFSYIEVYKSGKVQIKYYDINSKDINTPLYTYDAKPIQQVNSPTAIDTQNYYLPSHIYIAPNSNLTASSWKRFMQGANYRQEWVDPVRIPILDVGKEGLHAVKQSGGSQLRVLALQDKKGKIWELRSIERFPQNIIPSDLRVPVNVNEKEDALSASYPFASLVAGALQRSAGIPTVQRRMVYVPNDPRLDRFRNDFKNSVALLEEQQPDHIKKTIGTNDLVLKLQNDNNNQVDQRRVLRARLMDNFIMDFNRGDNQWTWATYDTGRNRIYYPIPQNPSHAFFVSEGVIPWLSQRILAIPEIQGFGSKADNVVSFNRTNYNFDHFFLNGLSEEDWQKEIDTFLSVMTDSVIVAAVREKPVTAAENSSESIIKRLKNRRDVFRDEMLRYYHFISRDVTIIGSKQNETFLLSKDADGKLCVEVTEVDVKGKVITKVYKRSFSPDFTKELRIYGLEGNDSFIVKGIDKSVRLRLIGGPGTDVFTGDGYSDALVYDVSFEDNIVTGNFESHIDADPLTNTYNRQQFRYDYMSPGLAASYNIDEGVLIGAELEFFKNKFRKAPYAARHLLQTEFATNTAAWHFRYEADFIKVINKQDLIVRADVRAPVNITNYFGLGTATNYDQNRGIGYYRTRYDIGTLNVAVRKQLQSWMSADIGPVFQYYKVEDGKNSGKFLTDTSDNIGNPVIDFNDPQYFLGAEAKINMNSKNNPVLPTRGAVLNMSARQLFGLNGGQHIVTQLRIDLSIFMSLVPNTKTVLATRFGVGHNIGNFDFPQAQYLSGTENLRGFRKDRFAGRTAFFNNTELRLRFGQFRTYLFPGSWGMLIFNDIGRVWTDGENAAKWHDGFGGGLWVSPVQRFVITGTVAYSNEEEFLPMVGFGFRF